MNPDQDPDLTIVLLGHSGVGKSASGNTILGREAFESRKAFKPVTREISERRKIVLNKNISVIDTPAILTSEQEVRAKCQEVMCFSRRKLFLLVVKIDRFTKEQQEAVEAAIRTVGEDGLKNSFMLFTHGDTLNNKTLEDFLREVPDTALPELVGRFAGTHVFNNNENRKREQIRKLLQKSEGLPNIVRPRGNTEKRRIVLLGLPGAGKSSTGNTILGSDRCRSECSFNLVTTESASESAVVEDRKVAVIDTPGFTARFFPTKKLYSEIKKAMEYSSPGPHAFVIVVRLGRISRAEIKLFKLLRKLLCSDAPKYTVVLFTYGDELRGQSIKDHIKSNSCVSDLVSMCGGRYCVFDNTRQGNRQQVKDLLDTIDEMVTANDEGYYTIERFQNVQTGLMKVYVDWDRFLDWFRQILEKIDDISSANNREGYTRLNNESGEETVELNHLKIT